MQNSIRSNFWVCLAFFVLLSVLVALWKFNRRTRYSHELQTCQRLLRTSTLTKRAAANTRFCAAFGIENSFTTTDHLYYKTFRASIEEGLDGKNTNESRIELGNKAAETIRGLLEREEDIALEKLVKIVVFRAILSIFFPQTPQPSTSDVEFLTHAIDSQWYESKSPIKIFIATHFPIYSEVIRNRISLHIKVKQIFLPHLSLSQEISPRWSPLNVLLPAYSGVWKVVLNGLLEVRFRSSPQDRKSYRQLLSAFITAPNENWYKKSENEVSVQAIIAETMRLYPPTRRIYTLGPYGISRAVDIEALHRSGDVWGRDPEKFDPERWVREGLSVIETQEYMPFGSKEPSISRCPSRKRGGPKLCAILLGALVEHIGDDLELVTRERNFKLSNLVADRYQVFKGLNLVKKPSQLF